MLNITISIFFLPFNYNWMDQEMYIYISWLAFIRPSKNSTFHYHCPDGLKLITRLRLGSSHLRFHKFKHNFQDTLNPICSCGNVETNIHYLLHCLIFSDEKLTPFNKLQSIDQNILSKDNSNISKVLFFGDDTQINLKVKERKT